MAPSQLEALPDELLLRIFRHLRAYDPSLTTGMDVYSGNHDVHRHQADLSSLALVSHRIGDVASTVLYERISHSCLDRSVPSNSHLARHQCFLSSVQRASTRLQHTTHLSLGDDNEGWSMELLDYAPNIQTLKLSYSTVQNNPPFRDLVNRLIRLKHLHTLQLHCESDWDFGEGSDEDDDAPEIDLLGPCAEMLSKTVESLPNLQTLYFTLAQPFNPVLLRHVRRPCRPMSLKKVYLGDYALPLLSHFDAPRLEILGLLEHDRLCTSSVLTEVGGIAGFTSLRNLVVNLRGVHEVWMETLSQLQQLEHLTLEGWNWRRDIDTRIFTQLPASLVRLTWSKANMRGAQILSEFVSSLVRTGLHTIELQLFTGLLSNLQSAEADSTLAPSPQLLEARETLSKLKRVTQDRGITFKLMPSGWPEE